MGSLKNLRAKVKPLAKSVTHTQQDRSANRRLLRFHRTKYVHTLHIKQSVQPGVSNKISNKGIRCRVHNKEGNQEDNQIHSTEQKPPARVEGRSPFVSLACMTKCDSAPYQKLLTKTLYLVLWYNPSPPQDQQEQSPRIRGLHKCTCRKALASFLLTLKLPVHTQAHQTESPITDPSPTPHKNKTGISLH